jgi:hypothetical protein
MSDMLFISKLLGNLIYWQAIFNPPPEGYWQAIFNPPPEGVTSDFVPSPQKLKV